MADLRRRESARSSPTRAGGNGRAVPSLETLGVGRRAARPPIDIVGPWCRLRRGLIGGLVGASLLGHHGTQGCSGRRLRGIFGAGQAVLGFVGLPPRNEQRLDDRDFPWPVHHRAWAPEDGVSPS